MLRKKKNLKINLKIQKILYNNNQMLKVIFWQQFNKIRKWRKRSVIGNQNKKQQKKRRFGLKKNNYLKL